MGAEIDESSMTTGAVGDNTGCGEEGGGGGGAASGNFPCSAPPPEPGV